MAGWLAYRLFHVKRSGTRQRHLDDEQGWQSCHAPFYSAGWSALNRGHVCLVARWHTDRIRTPFRQSHALFTGWSVADEYERDAAAVPGRYGWRSWLRPFVVA